MIDLTRGWRTLGFSHFGAAFAVLAFTCGPHHLTHGIHILFEGRVGGPLDLVTALVGLPAGLVWFALRVEAFAGGRGDRPITGTPLWVMVLPTLAGAYLTALVATTVAAGGTLGAFNATIVPNVLLVAIYPMIGYYLLRTQLQNHRDSGDWSLSGLCLTLLFFTCSLMHATYIFYAATGIYRYDIHGLVIDWLSVPAGLYFLVVVQGLYQARLKDWNRDVASSPLVPAG